MVALAGGRLKLARRDARAAAARRPVSNRCRSIGGRFGMTWLIRQPRAKQRRVIAPDPQHL